MNIDNQGVGNEHRVFKENYSAHEENEDEEEGTCKESYRQTF